MACRLKQIGSCETGQAMGYGDFVKTTLPLRTSALLALVTALVSGCSSKEGASTAPQPIAAADQVWTWVPFPTAVCMNGSPTGIGVNLSSQSSKVLIFLQYGGACFNADTCAVVENPNGFGINDFNELVETMKTTDTGVLNRSDPANPFNNWNMVFIPYCTGDVHAGSNPNGYDGGVQVGYINFGEYLKRIVPTFPQATQVVLAGASAGGFGAILNYDRTQQAFGSIPVSMLDDSAPPMSDVYLAPCLESLWRQLFLLDKALPSDCTGCFPDGGGGFSALPAYLAQKYPNANFGLISSEGDSTIREFFGFGLNNCASIDVVGVPPNYPQATYTQGLLDLNTNTFAPYNNSKVFYIASTTDPTLTTKHTWLLDDSISTVSINGVSLSSWVNGFIDGGADWVSVIP